MKRSLKTSFFLLVLVSLQLFSCKKLCDLMPAQYNQQINNITLRSRYSTLSEFRKGIAQANALVASYHIYAYLDTLSNGLPDTYGRKILLCRLGYNILEKLNGNDQEVASGVYDVFHFDEATFSYISFLIKARIVGEITAQILVNIMAYIPLPPVPVDGFDPPKEPAPDTTTNCCDHCNPNIKIKVTWAFKPPCGNYETKTSGYAANNTLNHMSSGKLYRFDAEVTGCACPGTWTNSITTPANAAYGYSSAAGNSVTLFPQSSGTYTVTFTYNVCGKTVTKTFTLTVE